MFGADVETRFFSRDCFTNFGKLAVQALVSAAAWLRSSFSVALRIALFFFLSFLLCIALANLSSCLVSRFC